MAQLCEEKNGEIQCHVHPNYIWQLMLRPIVALVLILLALNLAYLYAGVQSILPWLFAFDILFINILLAVIMLVPSYIWIWMEYRSFIYIIKKEELVIRKGVIRKRYNSIPYNKIRNVQRTQSTLEMIIGLCTVRVETGSLAEGSKGFPDTVIHGMLNSPVFTEIILKKMRADQTAGTDLGDTTRQMLSQLMDMNKQDQTDRKQDQKDRKQDREDRQQDQDDRQKDRKQDQKDRQQDQDDRQQDQASRKKGRKQGQKDRKQDQNERQEKKS